MSHRARDAAVFAVAAIVLLAGIAGAVAIADARHAVVLAKTQPALAVATHGTPAPVPIHVNPFHHQSIQPSSQPQRTITRTRAS